MILSISFKHIKSSPEIKAYAEKRTEKLKKYFNGQIHVSWNFTFEKNTPIAHCHLVGNDMDYFGEEKEEENLKSSIDSAVSKIERQIKKHKEIVTNKLHQPGARKAKLKALEK